MPITVRLRLILPDTLIRSRSVPRTLTSEPRFEVSRSLETGWAFFAISCKIDRDFRLQHADRSRHRQLTGRGMRGQTRDSEDSLARRDQVRADVAQMHALGIIAQVPVSELDRAADLRRAHRTGQRGIDRERACRSLAARFQHRIRQCRIEFTGDLEIQRAAGIEGAVPASLSRDARPVLTCASSWAASATRRAVARRSTAARSRAVLLARRNPVALSVTSPDGAEEVP